MTPSALETAQKLAPLIRDVRDEIEAARELPRPLFEALADAGMFHLAVPREHRRRRDRLPDATSQVIEEIGKADASTGWAVNQGAIYATYAARMPPRSRARSGSTRRAACRQHAAARPRKRSSCPAAIASPAARASAPAAATPRGSPRTRRSSRTARSGTRTAQPETRYLLRPGRARRSCSTPGTCAACAAPARITSPSTTCSSRPSARCSRRPRRCIADGPLYRIPRTLLFAGGDAAVALGIARSCLNAFSELAGSRRRAPCRAAARAVDRPGRRRSGGGGAALRHARS